MRRRDFIALLGGGTAASLSFQIHAQTVKVPRIGYLSPAAARNPVDEAFETSLQQLGWMIDRDIKIEYHTVTPAAGRTKLCPLSLKLPIWT